ncbi:MAG: indolepyruvate oxidoreductase subunit beta [Coriobacteriales bacterium]|jgi:indolepyruvate ferredoxin oxidoreductase beta subunit|nr:indolepyruvate oxidoreductase subunit beta [Coriobacteriales bacterium]
MTRPSDIIIAGVGGQGTVLASKLLAQAALLEGRMVRAAETIGMAQRGGSVLGHVRIAPSPKPETTSLPSAAQRRADLTPLSPLVPHKTAELLIGFEPGEAIRALDYLRHGGTVVTAIQALEPVTASLANLSYDGKAELDWLRACKRRGRIGMLIPVDGAALCAELGSTRVLNIVLLGAALATGNLDVSAAALEEAIGMLVKPQYVSLNQTALARGMTLL